MIKTKKSPLVIYHFDHTKVFILSMQPSLTLVLFNLLAVVLMTIKNDWNKFLLVLFFFFFFSWIVLL